MYLVVQSTTRAIYFPKEDTYAHEGTLQIAIEGKPVRLLRVCFVVVVCGGGGGVDERKAEFGDNPKSEPRKRKRTPPPMLMLKKETRAYEEGPPLRVVFRF